jgi:hypothetical protein
MFSHIKNDGIYLCEDCHTSYWPSFGGGYKRKGTFIEYSKNFIDQINAYHIRLLKLNDVTHYVNSITYYDSVIVIKKCTKKSPPHSEKTGVYSLPYKVKKRDLKYYFYTYINAILALLRIKGFAYIYKIKWQ